MILTATLFIMTCFIVGICMDLARLHHWFNNMQERLSDYKAEVYKLPDCHDDWIHPYKFRKRGYGYILAYSKKNGWDVVHGTWSRIEQSDKLLFTKKSYTGEEVLVRQDDVYTSFAMADIECQINNLNGEKK